MARTVADAGEFGLIAEFTHGVEMPVGVSVGPGMTVPFSLPGATSWSARIP